MSFEQSRRRREHARRRRRQRRIAFAAVLLLVVAGGAAVAAALSKSERSSSASASARAERASKPKPVLVRPTLSADGLPLGTAPLALAGLGEPERDAVHIAFRHPPRAGLLFNVATGQILWQRNPYARLRVASLTKMMTALLTVESQPPDAPVLVTKAAVEAGGSKVGVLPRGRRVRLETLLYGLMLPSGNDAAVALAEHDAGSIGAFVERMNAEAAKLGMSCTRYSSPSGYLNAENFSCAADLALLTHVDLAQPRIASVARTYSAELPLPIKGGKVWLYNNNPLLIYRYPGTTGMKTGYTEAAGRCLVATAKRDGVELGAIVLNSSDPGNQARQLLNRGFEGVYRQAPVRETPMPAGA